MNLVEALNRVFEKVLGSNTTDSKNLLDDYIGGGGGNGGDSLHLNISTTDTEHGTKYTLDKTAGEIIEALDTGKTVIADLAVEGSRILFFCCGYFIDLEMGYSIGFLDALKEFSPEGKLNFSAEGVDEYPSFESGGK